MFFYLTKLDIVMYGLHITKFVLISETTDSKCFITTQSVHLDEAIEKIGKLICTYFTKYTFII